MAANYKSYVIFVIFTVAYFFSSWILIANPKNPRVNLDCIDYADFSL